MTVPAERNTQQRPLIGITMGDPLGIGPETIVKTLADPKLRARARFIIFGLEDALELAADQAEINPFWWREPYDHGPRVASGVLLSDFDHLGYAVNNGRHEPDPLAGHASYIFVEEAIQHLRGGQIDALVTGPICKQSWRLAKHRTLGHTELLADRFDAKRVTMMFVAHDLRVALASTHVPLFELRNRFTIGLVHQPIDLLDSTLREWFGIEEPHIGVLGVNPHAGEDGLIGDEEQRIIEPALAMARNNRIRVSGPIPPDTAFTPVNRRRFDGFVAMYHDQGLIPVKMLAFDQAVQLTLGLGAIRVSPDHGTAFDIAGRNQADPSSMRAAVELAVELAERQRVTAAAK